MSSTFEMNGTVVYQGRPKHGSKDGKNWCYSIVFLVNTSVPVCDLRSQPRTRAEQLCRE